MRHLYKLNNCGFSLIELLLGMLLGSFLLLGLVSSFAASSTAFRAIDSHYQLLQSSSHAVAFIESRVRSAGFPNIRNNDFPAAISTASFVEGDNDVLELEGWSRQNCFGNPNPRIDADGRPALFFRRQRFRLVRNALRWLCDYGPERGSLVRQSNNQSLIDGVIGFRLAYFEDRDLDDHIDTSVRAGGWNQAGSIQQLQLTLKLVNDNGSLQRSYQTNIQLRNPG